MRTLRLESFEKEIDLGHGKCHLEVGTFKAGLSAGVQVIKVRTPSVCLELLPTRGMGIYRCELDGRPFGWQSPIGMPVHPQFVPLSEPSGLGFLDGPTELMFRCGLESNGTPDFEPDGRLRFGLHGRVANLPACYAEVRVDRERQEILISGHVKEQRFLRQKLELKTEYAVGVHDASIRWTDRVTNIGRTPAAMQMIYHTNIGEPFLKPGSKVVAAVNRVCPRDETGVQSGIDNWYLMPPHRDDSWEQVYFAQLTGDSNGQTEVLVVNPQGDAAIGLAYNTTELPWFTLWRNTQASQDGYVLGIEPGTNLPNPRSWEEKFGRLVNLMPDEVWSTSLKLQSYTGLQAVADASAAIQACQAQAADLSATPIAEWTPSG